MLALSEFDVIRQYLNRPIASRSDVSLGIGDDGALLQCRAGCELVVTMDTLVSGVHFPTDTQAAHIGHKALAVNLSDLAAMGAEPAWVTLSLTMPEISTQWLTDFCSGFFGLADVYGVQLVGGDMSQGPLSITVQAHGFVPQGLALRRDGAKVGDRVFVSGVIGEAGLGLQIAKNLLQMDDLPTREHLLARLNTPQPRLELGLALRSMAHAAIDVSDGLAADLGHILAASQVGATLSLETLPVAACFQAIQTSVGGWQQPLNAGDDYELCFTVAETQVTALHRAKSELECSITQIGVIESQPGLRFSHRGRIIQVQPKGYEHFRGKS